MVHTPILRRVLAAILGLVVGALSGCWFFRPLPGPACWWITPAIPLRQTTQGEVFLSQAAVVDYEGGSVFLASLCDGTGDVWVDDAVSVTVRHPDGTSETQAIDFSFGCQGYISTLAPQDLTSLFAIGDNTVQMKLFDICGVHVGCTALYLALEHGVVHPATTLLGIDVNATQGDAINWGSVLSAGYSFVFVKATAGDAASPALRNQYFEHQATRAKAAGLKVGVYHYAYPQLNTPEDEAQYFLSVAGEYVREGYLRPALDIEEGQGSTSTGISLSEWIRRWIEAVEAETGVEAIIYANTDYAKDLEPWLADPETGYDLWIAHWRCSSSGSPNSGQWHGRWVFWQYWAPTTPVVKGCGHNYVPGIGYDVDLDVFRGGMNELQAYVIPYDSVACLPQTGAG